MISTTIPYGFFNLSEWRSHYDNNVDIVDLIHVADMDETYGTSVDDEYVDNHDYDDDTDDDT